MSEAATQGRRRQALGRIVETMNGRNVEWWPIRNEPETEPLGLYFNLGEPPEELTLLAIAESYGVTIEVVRWGLPHNRCSIYITDTEKPGLTYDDD
jgi:hypothetical protein